MNTTSLLLNEDSQEYYMGAINATTTHTINEDLTAIAIVPNTLIRHSVWHNILYLKRMKSSAPIC